MASLGVGAGTLVGKGPVPSSRVKSAGAQCSIRGADPGKGSAGGTGAGQPISLSQRQTDLEANRQANPRGHYHCTNCGYENTDPRHFDVDHIIPMSQNRDTTPANRRILCVGCNRSAQEGWPPNPGSDWATRHKDWDLRP